MGATPGKESSEDYEKRAIKILSIGIHCSGKSTFARHVRGMFHPPTENEINNYRNILMQNLFLGIGNIVQRAEDIEYSFDEEIAKSIKYFKKVNPYDTKIDAKSASHARKLFDHKNFQKAIKKVGKTEFTEALNYVYHNLDRMAEPNWTPMESDWLRLRQRTSGTSQTHFRAGNHNWILTDIGGEPVERRKWAPNEINANAILFFVALDEYDVMSEFSPEKTKMDESLEVWDSVVNSEAVHNKPVILLFNKKDLFMGKIKRKALKNYFADFKGENDFKSTVNYIKDKYLSRVKKGGYIHADSVYCRTACAIDPENIKFIFKAIQDYIIKQRLTRSNVF